MDTSCHLIRQTEYKEVIIASLNLLKVLCGIFQPTILGQYLDDICDAIRSLHEKRATSSGSVGEELTAAAPPITKSQRIRQLVKLVLKKLMRKFTYELIAKKMFVCGESKISGVVKHGLENLLSNLKKMNEKERAKKMDEQQAESKNHAALDLISVYTAAASQQSKVNLRNEYDFLKYF